MLLQKKRTREKKREAETPLEATQEMVKKRGFSTKVNYDALKGLFEPTEWNNSPQVFFHFLQLIIML